ncbi:hypothetical protein [Estrella lausannensis]|uniref:Uncharacterized protein n=1 Tax=Estrella lausannensis TaxID=483423 RepID=A0A0H5DPE2_9BACT|nr:hypothetical protein [Estrella lausannensis]CRX38292.1 hypothetical protein ELAC_0945 [Estrella lausannensis]
MNFTISSWTPNNLKADAHDAKPSPDELSHCSDRLLSLNAVPLSNQAYLASRVLLGSWNNKHFFAEGEEVRAKIGQCYFSAIDFLLSKHRLVGVLTGAVLGKRSKKKYNPSNSPSLYSLGEVIRRQRVRLESGDCSLCFATFARIMFQNERILITTIQGKETDGTHFLLTASSKISHIQRFHWRVSNVDDTRFLPLILSAIPDSAIYFTAWSIKKERIAKTLNKLPLAAARKVTSVSRLPQWTIGVWVQVNLQFPNRPLPSPTVKGPLRQIPLLARIDHWIKNSFTEILPHGLQLQALHQTQVPLQEILDVTTTPDSLLSHCKINALGLAARISGPMTVHQYSENAAISKFSVFEEELKAFGAWILSARNQERAALSLFYLKAACLKRNEGSASFYGSHLFLILMTNRARRNGEASVAYNVYGSYLGNYRIKQLKKSLSVGESSLSEYEFSKLVLTPLRTILSGKEWTAQHDDSYFSLFSVRKPKMLHHEFQLDAETNSPVESMPFKATIIPFKAKGRAEIVNEERRWNSLNSRLPVAFYAMETYDHLFPNRCEAHLIRLRDVQTKIRIG